MWDTAGQERYKSVTQGFYRNAIGIFLVYEISKKETFDEIPVYIVHYQIEMVERMSIVGIFVCKDMFVGK